MARTVDMNDDDDQESPINVAARRGLLVLGFLSGALQKTRVFHVDPCPPLARIKPRLEVLKAADALATLRRHSCVGMANDVVLCSRFVSSAITLSWILPNTPPPDTASSATYVEDRAGLRKRRKIKAENESNISTSSARESVSELLSSYRRIYEDCVTETFSIGEDSLRKRGESSPAMQLLRFLVT
jgi:hypothetical protein